MTAKIVDRGPDGTCWEVTLDDGTCALVEDWGASVAAYVEDPESVQDDKRTAALAQLPDGTRQGVLAAVTDERAAVAAAVLDAFYADPATPERLEASWQARLDDRAAQVDRAAASFTAERARIVAQLAELVAQRDAIAAARPARDAAAFPSDLSELAHLRGRRS